MYIQPSGASTSPNWIPTKVSYYEITYKTLEGITESLKLDTSLYDVIYSLQENKLIPVLAHPERYSFIQKEPELVYDLIEKGVLMQANYGSILGQYGEKAEMIVRKFFENNMIHFLGSDVHRQNTIYKMIPQALDEIRAIIGDEKLEELTTENPKLALNNKRIEIRNPQEVTLTLKEKIIMHFKR